MDIVERLLSRIKINAAGCFEWQGGRSKNGYGVLAGKWPWNYAHRASFEVFRAKIPCGMYVCHHCDNRCCINPAHLFLGTQLDNIRDAANKGRMRRGVENPASKLTPSMVVEIKKMLAAGNSMRSIGRHFGVSEMAIIDIHSGHTWKHLV